MNMASTSGVTRGYLRPGGLRSPPFLIIGLIIIAAISVFNYWNLSTQYGDLVNEITELQDHIKIATSKRETAEKHVETLGKQVRDFDNRVGKLKVEIDAKNIKIANLQSLSEQKDLEIQRIQTELQEAKAFAREQNDVKDQVQLLEKDIDRLKQENQILNEKNEVLKNTLDETRLRKENEPVPPAPLEHNVPQFRRKNGANGKTVVPEDHVTVSSTVSLNAKLQATVDERPDVDDAEQEVEEDDAKVNLNPAVAVEKSLEPLEDEKSVDGEKLVVAVPPLNDIGDSVRDNDDEDVKRKELDHRERGKKILRIKAEDTFPRSADDDKIRNSAINSSTVATSEVADAENTSSLVRLPILHRMMNSNQNVGILGNKSLTVQKTLGHFNVSRDANATKISENQTNYLVTPTNKSTSADSQIAAANSTAAALPLQSQLKRIIKKLIA